MNTFNNIGIISDFLKPQRESYHLPKERDESEKSEYYKIGEQMAKEAFEKIDREIEKNRDSYFSPRFFHKK